jgi:hypothetical protein
LRAALEFLESILELVVVGCQQFLGHRLIARHDCAEARRQDRHLRGSRVHDLFVCHEIRG